MQENTPRRSAMRNPLSSTPPAAQKSEHDGARDNTPNMPASEVKPPTIGELNASGALPRCPHGCRDDALTIATERGFVCFNCWGEWGNPEDYDGPKAQVIG